MSVRTNTDERNSLCIRATRLQVAVEPQTGLLAPAADRIAPSGAPIYARRVMRPS